MSVRRRHPKERGWNTGQAVEELVTSRGLTVGAFADAMRFSRATAYNRFKQASWEWPDIEMAGTILGVQSEWLDRGTGEKLAPYAAERVNSPEIQKAITDIMMDLRAKLLGFAEIVAQSAIKAKHPPRSDVRLFRDDA